MPGIVAAPVVRLQMPFEPGRPVEDNVQSEPTAPPPCCNPSPAPTCAVQPAALHRRRRHDQPQNRIETGAATASGFLLNRGALAADTIRLIVPFALGSSSDAAAKLIQEPFANAMGRAVVIDYVTGEGSKLAARQTIRSKPDVPTFAEIMGDHRAAATYSHALWSAASADAAFTDRATAALLSIGKNAAMHARAHKLRIPLQIDGPQVVLDTPAGDRQVIQDVYR